jgi:hypothetical protein
MHGETVKFDLTQVSDRWLAVENTALRRQVRKVQRISWLAEEL